MLSATFNILFSTDVESETFRFLCREGYVKYKFGKIEKGSQLTPLFSDFNVCLVDITRTNIKGITHGILVNAIISHVLTDILHPTVDLN